MGSSVVIWSTHYTHTFYVFHLSELEGFTTQAVEFFSIRAYFVRNKNEYF